MSAPPDAEPSASRLPFQATRRRLTRSPRPVTIDGRCRPLILIADDDGVSRKLLRRLLEQDGHAVRAAANGVEALELFAEEAIDIVLLDIVMPELDGISVLERLKATPGANHVPVIMISAVDETESVVRCIEIGADDYLPEAVQPRDPPREDQRRV